MLGGAVGSAPSGVGPRWVGSCPVFRAGSSADRPSGDGACSGRSASARRLFDRAARWFHALAGAGIGGVVAAALAGAALADRQVLAAVLVVVQSVLALAWLRLLRVPATFAGWGLASGAALAADLLLLRHRVGVLGALADVVAIALVVGIVGQLGWRRRRRVTEVVAAQVSAVLLGCGAACFIAVRGGHRGRDAALTALLALAAGAVVGRLAGTAVRQPALVPSRGLLGPLAWTAVGAAVGAAVLGVFGAYLGAATGCAGGFAEAAVAGPQRGRRSVLVGALLPVAVSGPVAYVLSRVLFG